MKKILLTTASAIVFSVSTLFAGGADMFQLNESKLDADFQKLDKVEAYVKGNDVSKVEDIDASLLENMELSSDASSILSSENEPALGIPSFVWGFCLGWVGILVTYLITEDKEETKKALIGCVVGALAGVVIWLVFFVIIGIGASSTL